MQKKYALAIHGGAGTMSPEQITPEIERDLRAGLQRSLHAGYAILRNGGSSLDAVTAAVRVLEDDPLFNAGRGAVFTSAETHEMDAAIMDGGTLRAGAVGGVSRVRNPIDLARAVMEKSRHVMLAGRGAEDFARELGFEIVDDEYFHTEQRRRALERVRAGKAEPLSDADRHALLGRILPSRPIAITVPAAESSIFKPSTRTATFQLTKGSGVVILFSAAAPEEVEDELRKQKLELPRDADNAADRQQGSLAITKKGGSLLITCVGLTPCELELK